MTSLIIVVCAVITIAALVVTYQAGKLRGKLEERVLWAIWYKNSWDNMLFYTDLFTNTHDVPVESLVKVLETYNETFSTVPDHCLEIRQAYLDQFDKED